MKSGRRPSPTRTEAGWTFYFGAAFFCIIGLWALYVWQLRLEAQMSDQLALAHRNAVPLPKGASVTERFAVRSLTNDLPRSADRSENSGSRSTAPKSSFQQPSSLASNHTAQTWAPPKPGLTILRQASDSLSHYPEFEDDLILNNSPLAADDETGEAETPNPQNPSRRFDQVANGPLPLKPQRIAASDASQPDLRSQTPDPIAGNHDTNTLGSAANDTQQASNHDASNDDIAHPSKSTDSETIVETVAETKHSVKESPSSGAILLAPASKDTTREDPAARVANENPLRSNNQDSEPPKSPFQLSSKKTETTEDDSRGPRKLRSAAIEAAKEANQQLPRVVVWPTPKSLLMRLDRLESTSEYLAVANAVQASLQEIRGFESLSDSRVPVVLQRLVSLATTLEQTPTNPSAVSSLAAETSFDLRKRIGIWSAIHQLAAALPIHFVGLEAISTEDVESAFVVVQQVSEFLKSDAYGQPWYDYLLMDELLAATSDREVTETEKELIRRALRRLHSTRLNSKQQDFIAAEPMAGLTASLGALLTPEVTLDQLLKLTEAYEQTGHAAYGRLIGREIEGHMFSGDQNRQRLAQQLEVNYRNANLRFTISDKLLNRLVPSMDAIEEPVNDRLLGARILGTSRTSNQLGVQLVPDEERLHFGLTANGTVLSRTRAFKDGFIFHNRGQARYQASKFLSFDRNGILVSRADAAASSSQQTTDIQSDYDKFPLIGGLARSIAVNQKNDKERVANQLVERKVADIARERLDDETHQRLMEARRTLRQEVIDPLQRLGLEPQPIKLRTTTDRLVIRYRLAAPEQLASYAPRPQALTRSLASFQVHESVINNFADSMKLGGKRFDLPQLAEHLAEQLERELTLGDGVDETLLLEFPETGWLKATFDEDKVKIKLTFKRLGLNGKRPWNDLAVEAVYLPMVDGRQVKLFRDPEEAIKISGRRIRMADQFAIRGIMNTVFQPEQLIDIIPERIVNDPRIEGTTIGQMVIQNGWLAVSMVDAPQPEAVEAQDRTTGRPVRRLLNEVLR